MAKKTTQTTAMAGVAKGVVTFEPVSAPLSAKRQVMAAGEKADTPKFSLVTPAGTKVYGLEDITEFGRTGAMSRLNSFERYGDADWLEMFQVAMLHLFGQYRGTGERITPLIGVSVPIAIYNDVVRVEALKRAIVGEDGKMDIADAAGCCLKLGLSDKKIIIVPESTRATYHYAFDAKTLAARTPRGVGAEIEDFDVNGAVIVADCGYLTLNLSLHENLKYIPASSYTFGDMGMGKVVRAIADASAGDGRGFEVSAIDTALRGLAGEKLEGPKHVKIGAVTYDVGDIYNAGVIGLAQQVAQAILNNYHRKVTKVVLVGGSAHHIAGQIKSLLPFSVSVCPDPGEANVLGTLTWLRREAAKRGSDSAMIAVVDVGNGRIKGASTETV